MYIPYGKQNIDHVDIAAVVEVLRWLRLFRCSVKSQ
jgi:hypothetical protein